MCKRIYYANTICLSNCRPCKLTIRTVVASRIKKKTVLLSRTNLGRNCLRTCVPRANIISVAYYCLPLYRIDKMRCFFFFYVIFKHFTLISYINTTNIDTRTFGSIPLFTSRYDVFGGRKNYIDFHERFVNRKPSRAIPVVKILKLSQINEHCERYSIISHLHEIFVGV